jgi:hypothetical protein
MSGPCPQCGGLVQVVNTFIVGECRVRYYGCRQCGYRPERNKQTVPLIYAPRRTRLIQVATPTLREADTSGKMRT